LVLLTIYSLLTGLGGYFVKITHGINAQQILFFRAFFASIFLIGVAVFSKKIKELKFRYPVNTVLMALVQGLSIFFYYLALERTSIANSLLLLYTAPVFSVILSAIFLHEKIESKTLFAIIFSFLGVLIVTDPSKIRIDPQQFYGSLFALLGGFFYSAMAISSKSLTHKTTPLYAAFWQYFLIFLIWFFLALPIKVSLIKTNLIPLLYLGWMAGGLAFLLYMKGIKMVKGQIIQVITMLEIPVGALSGVILLNEKLTSNTIIGGILILFGVFIVSSKNKTTIKSSK